MISQNDPAGLAHAKKLIKECLETQATFLDIGNCGLFDLSELPELWECQHLEELSFGPLIWNGKEYLESKNTFESNKIGYEGAKVVAEKLKPLTSLNLGWNQIGYEGAKVIAENLTYLTSLDLASNKIGHEGAMVIAENLASLTSLNLWSNKIGHEGAKVIAENLTSLTSLYLGNNKIEYEGAKVIAENLTSLNSLDLGSNNIGDEGAKAIAENLTSLTSLNLWSNKIGYKGAKVIAKNLTSLTSLDLGDNKIGFEGAKVIAKNLTSLTSLDLRDNKIGYEGAKVIAENLPSLNSLDLGSNKIGYEGAKVIAENLTSLTSLNLWFNKIGYEGARVIAENLTFLTSLDLWDNQIRYEGAKVIAENLTSLTSLKLWNNQIGDKGAKVIAKNLKSLTSLHLWNNQITQSLYFKELQNLKSLELNFNPLIDIPLALSTSFSDIKNWWAETESNTEPNQIIKLMVNGNGNVGKSTLIEALQKGRCEVDKDSTHGIIIEKWPYEEANKQVDFHIWDFGGQEIFHGTHRLFMQAEAVWLHVFDVQGENAARNGEAVVDRIIAEESGQNHVIQYWIDEAGNSKQNVIIQTKKEKVGYETKDEVVSNLAHEQKTDFVFVDSYTGSSIHRLRSIIHEKALEINEYGMAMPAKWISIRKYFLENLQIEENQKLISKNEFYRLCTEQYSISENVIPTLITFLHHSGVIYYNKQYLGDTIIADQSWAINAIYQPLKRDSSFYRNMRKLFFGRVTLDIIYDGFGEDYTKPQKALFVNLMESCGLCYAMNANKSKADEQNTWYVFPEFLPSEPSNIIETVWSKVDTYRTFIKKLPYLNYFRIQQYISKYGKKTEKELVWRNGVILNTDHGMIRVEADYKNPSIIIKIASGINDKEIADILEIRRTSDNEKESWVEINAEGVEMPLDLKGPSSHHTAKDKGKNENFVESLPDVVNKGPFKLAVSFASEDMQAMKDLIKIMSEFTESGKVQLLYDKKVIDGSEGYDASLRKMFENADGYLILASMDYQFKSEKIYIWEKEIPIIKERHEKLRIPTWLLAVAPVRLNSDLAPLAGFKNCKMVLPESGHGRTTYLLEFVTEVIENVFLKDK